MRWSRMGKGEKKDEARIVHRSQRKKRALDEKREGKLNKETQRKVQDSGQYQHKKEEEEEILLSRSSRRLYSRY